jgi:hypothetical protein
MSISSLNDINYFCFNSNPIFIIPHDLYDYNNQQNKFSKEIKSLKSTENNNSFENLSIVSFLTDNWKNRIKKTVTSSKMKILKQLGIKN